MPMEIHEDKIVMRAGKYDLPRDPKRLMAAARGVLRAYDDETCGRKCFEMHLSILAGAVREMEGRDEN